MADLGGDLVADLDQALEDAAGHRSEAGNEDDDAGDGSSRMGLAFAQSAQKSPGAIAAAVAAAADGDVSATSDVIGVCAAVFAEKVMVYPRIG